MTFDEQMMHRCLQLAALGMGKVAPNPMVGAVIVHNGKIIGEGYHQEFGGPHAEVNAVNSVKDHSVFSESTIYVTLEPCSHFGKTPPCADLLVEKNFKRVVVGTLDAHAKVFKKGIKRLEDHGIDVTVGVCEKECLDVNRAFFTFHEKKRPFVLLKWAQTKNRLLDNSEGKQGEVSWISKPETQVIVHRWRSELQAIMVGKNTVINDNPSLTIRAVAGTNPTRIVLDSRNEIPSTATVKNSEVETIIFNVEKDGIEKDVLYIQLKELSPQLILESLYERNIQSVLIEGGQRVLQSFIDANLWDEARIITGNTAFKSGTAAPQINGQKIKEEVFFGDHISYLRPL
ncbi:MAG: bifunctional diaminohydroxyphosphoribosylaminopyrimidine deaminase/5-amino-6-(5-phosphoribosylamino)uracil reductase RibD [Crocinitomicaceae bacterium]|nr:bifunctional diaminohydroxyphosphoribosylaminopyrimidine deaminase/5-amino-6-(5-phosphoribosylamino)uracil reductase RibD [Crocinitomicaceae bacterium]